MFILSIVYIVYIVYCLRYVLIVKNVLFADAGIYKCSNVMQASLTVVAPPICAPRLLAPVEENHDLSVSCVVNFAGAPPGEDWGGS